MSADAIQASSGTEEVTLVRPLIGGEQSNAIAGGTTEVRDAERGRDRIHTDDPRVQARVPTERDGQPSRGTYMRDSAAAASVRLRRR